MTDFAAPAHRRQTGAPARTGRATARPRDDWRLMLVVAVFVLCYGAVAARMGTMALLDPEEPRLASFGGAEPVRGEIVDRNGALIAANLPAWSLYAHPAELKDPLATSQELAGIFPDMTAAEIARLLTSKNDFVWVRRPITPRQKAEVQDLGRPGLFFGARDMRIYPAGRAAAHIVGGVRAQSEGVRHAELVGSGGIERFFDDRLRDPARAGQPLALSIDLGAQQAMREVLSAEIARLNARGATGIVMNVRTGELITLVSLPDFDPNLRPLASDGRGAANPRFNRAVQGVYELGSVFKVLTAAMALELGIATPDTMIETGTPVAIGRNTIRDMHRMPDTLSLTDIVVRSSNTGTTRLALKIGGERMRGFLGRLGMFDPLPVEISEAARAKPLRPPRWADISTATISFGHGLSVSPMHFAAALATLANGGQKVTPTLIRGGNAPGERVFSERTSREMMAILREVVLRGTGRRTNIEGYEVGGKTGTADKPRQDGRGYEKDKVIATFAAVFPTSAPAYVMVISLDEPEDRSGPRPIREASRTAVPATAEAIRRIAPLLGLRPRGGRVTAELTAIPAAMAGN
ncbi:penicillin-binding protein 2 [Limibaculum sp. FT325]|uniref:peptidoglycan D,D-transpeptidase FtsI family protein n=1 Tax=Thermohalobaculum sediminis TaxID=2939436 RepID=UPI0020C14859|nr:penicillin-binding protein 2 [Limibaculum sediminis]MCL5777839.1 penicillin-binding protein 2 [Limibaculum sediminis]